MPLVEEQVLPPDSPPFKIRHFVSTIRGQDFSKCWPFSNRILERCLLLGMRVELPPLDSPANGYSFESFNSSTEISYKCSTKAESCDINNGSDHWHSGSVKLAELPRVLADLENSDICGTDAANMLGNSTFSNRLCLAFSQIPRDAAAVKLSTESFWDDNAISHSAGDSSSTSSQTMVQAKDELRDYVGVNLCGKSGGLHVAKDDKALIKEHDSVFQVSKEEGINTHSNQSTVPLITCVEKQKQEVLSEKPLIMCVEKKTQEVLSEIHPATCHDDALRVSKPPTPVHESVPQLTEFEELILEMEKRKHAADLLRSNTDAFMPQVCPICLKFSSGSNTALNAHIDHCLLVDKSNIRPSKKRFKIRKLRSMVDIYATAPTCTLEDLERSSHAWSLHKV